jgi:hypothetical protein
MPTHGAKLFGLRLYLTTTTSQVIDDWVLAPSSYHDSQVLPAVFEQSSERLVLRDGAYHNPSARPVLQERAVVVYAPPRRDNRKRVPWPAPVRRWVGYVRRRIETALSVLTTIFDIERPGSRSLMGLVCRISTRLLAITYAF